MKRPRRFLIVLAIEVALILALHAALVHWLAAKNVVAVLFAAGGHVPPGSLALAGLFVVVRLLAVLLLPGIILSRLAACAFERWAKRQVRTTNDGPTA